MTAVPLWPRSGASSSHAPTILAVVGTLSGLSTLIVLLRCYVRGLVLRKFNAEEYNILGAWLCAVGVLVCFVVETQHGVGRYNKDISNEDLGYLAKVVYFHSIIVMVGLSLVKISLAVFLRRFAQSWLRKALVGSIVFLVAFTIACALTLILECIPVAAAWDYSLRANARCFDSGTFTAIGLWNSITNLVTDVIFATLPVPMFIKIQVNLRTKASLIGVLSLGYLACVAGVIKIVAQIKVLKETDVYRNDTFMVWNCVELNVAIIAACLPSLKTLVKSLLDSTRNLTSGRRNAYGNYYPEYYGQRSADVTLKSMVPRAPHSMYNITVEGSSDGDSNSAHSGNREEDEQRLHRTEIGILKTTEVVVHTQQ
ncbi:oxidoreductase [Aspergillus japonicus CBS 114.51]|uniref:Oxidoreductase n=2 Tax=Aspergillus TaxID=5052 RepID=A0A2V5H123_ASPV1|nr:oxidoreductase [Aspergillus japonicus CBS 114.51]PYI17558.1 oxidoreductase [Aspergillus violaceofuscus CBS 115571]RAH82419.1 oxidoreductase [Aspergillus japonicus CBS 114.51]